ncbi:hypothetical protein, partial [Burkholderia pseudomallei]|uniref:hypothetical protein n=1 Tax=Burkholderia pseudomallei TaxID=28450 RepID=UPI001C4C0231
MTFSFRMANKTLAVDGAGRTTGTAVTAVAITAANAAASRYCWHDRARRVLQGTAQKRIADQNSRGVARTRMHAPARTQRSAGWGLPARAHES